MFEFKRERKHQCGRELNLFYCIWHSAFARACICSCVSKLWVLEEKEWIYVHNKRITQNILWTRLQTQTHAYIPGPWSCRIFFGRSSIYLMSKYNAYTHPKRIQNISKAHDLPGFLASFCHSPVYDVCAIVYCIVLKLAMFFLYRQLHAVQPNQSVALGLWDYEDCGIWSKFVFNHQNQRQ